MTLSEIRSLVALAEAKNPVSHARQLLAAVRHLLKMVEWQSIATAPKDKTEIDGWEQWEGRMTDIRWNAEGEYWEQLQLDEFDLLSWSRVPRQPTHWMPIVTSGAPEEEKRR